MSTQRVCFCGCMLQMFLQADEPMSSGSGDQADKRRPGWTGKQGKAYRKIKVPNSNCPHDRDAWIGTIKLGRLTSSLNVQCRACGCRINKRYKELRGGMWSLHPAQGRPMGSEVAWLNLECGTCPEYHRSLWNAHDLPKRDRALFREWANGKPGFARFFRMERDRFDDETGSEPEGLP